jgi:hypothetical protein
MEFLRAYALEYCQSREKQQSSPWIAQVLQRVTVRLPLRLAAAREIGERL